MFFFPETIKKRVQSHTTLLAKQWRVKVNIKYKTYDFDDGSNEFNRRCSEYFGFGYIASFIPRTNAFKARKRLSKHVGFYSKRVSSTIAKTIPNISDFNDIMLFKRWGMMTSLNGVVTDILLLGPLWRILDNNFATHFRISRISNNEQPSVKRLIACIPILSFFYYVDENRKAQFYPWRTVISNLFYGLRNPLRIAENALYFLQASLDRIIEIGAETRRKTNFIRGSVKGIIAIIFFVVAFPVKAGASILDFAFDLVKAVVYNPVKFVCLSTYNRCCKKTADQAEEATADERRLLIFDPAHLSMYTEVGAQQSGPQPIDRNRSQPTVVAAAAPAIGVSHDHIPTGVDGPAKKATNETSSDSPSRRPLH